MRRWSNRWLLGLPFLVALVIAVTAVHRQGALAAGSVSIHDFSFDPATVTIAVGDTVTWTNNQDGVPHTVTADDGSFDSGRLAPGKTFVMTFTRGGTIAYHCTIHPNIPSMHATIQVTAGPVTRSFPAGFNLVGVPAGTTLNARAIDTYDGTARMYRTLAADEQLRSGQGYWAFFDTATTITLPAGSNAPVTTNAPAGIWMLVGNPSGTTPALVTGADAVYTFDPTGQRYVLTTMLQPGDGAWAISQRGGAITVSPGATSAASSTPSSSSTQSPTQQATQQATQQPTQQATQRPNPRGY